MVIIDMLDGTDQENDITSPRLNVLLDVARYHRNINVRLVTLVRICYALRLVHNLMIVWWTAAFSKFPDSRPHLPSYTYIMDHDNDDDNSHLPPHRPMKWVRNIISRPPRTSRLVLSSRYCD